MHPELKPLVQTIEKLMATSEGLNWPHDTLSKSWGWNYPSLNKYDLKRYFENFLEKLDVYESSEADINDELLKKHITALEDINNILKNYASNNNNLHGMLGSLATSLLIIFSDLEHELFSWSRLKHIGLLPKSLAKRCESYEVQLNDLENRAGDLVGKIDAINTAHEAAESFPADLEYLKKARVSIQKEHEATLYKVSDILSEIKLSSLEIEKKKGEIESFLKVIKSQAMEANVLMKKCDDAFQVTTTQGIAAGFDQKANELKQSIWLYIVGLVLALGTGAFLGYLRVESFNELLTKDLTGGQAFIHTVMSIFSIGGPLWLAWICTQQINQRFRLSEDYSYKATVSKSFMGFSKLASRFDKETEERLFNSTLDRLEEMPLRLIEGKDYNSPWHEFVDSEAFKTAAKSFPQLASEAMRFAKSTKLKKKYVEPNEPSVTSISSEDKSKQIDAA